MSQLKSEGLLYPTALNQLFTGVYIMELCIIGLFLLARNDNKEYACLGQVVIMTVATVLTIGFHISLNRAFAPLLKYLPFELADWVHNKSEVLTELSNQKHPQGLWNWFIRFQNKIKNIMNTADCFKGEAFATMDESYNDVQFEHYAFHVESPVVWIPKDSIGIGDDEISYTQARYPNIRISNDWAQMTSEGNVTILGDLPG